MIEIYAKRQRVKRKNPQQEAIVSEKDKLNERTSKLIALMRSMKSGWNGGPSPEIGVEKFNLTQPLPDVVVGTGDAALHELTDIVQILRQVKTMQDNYSAARAQRAEQLKQTQPAPQEAPAQSPPQPLATASAVVDEFLKTASNPLTRIWTHLIAYNPFVSEKDRGQRLYLLRALARIDNNLKVVEDHVLSMGEASLLESVYIAKQLYSDAKSSFFGVFRKNIDEMLASADNQLEDLKKELKNKLNKKPEKGQLTNNVAVILRGVEDAQEAISGDSITSNDGYSTPEPNGEQPPLKTEPVRIPSEEQPEGPVKSKTLSRKVPSRTRRKRKVPIAQAPEVPNSDFIDSDFEQSQQVRYLEIAKYLYGNVDALVKQAHDVVQSNLSEPWNARVKLEYRKVYKLGELTVSRIRNGEDYEFDYLEFLKSVGVIKSIEYMASVQSQDDVTTTIDDGDVNSQADNFAKSEFSKYRDLATAKISQASTYASRFIKRMITHIIPRRDRNLRLLISRNVRQARSGLQGMLDTLEDRHLNFRRLSANSELFYDSLISCYEALADLADMYNSSMRIEKSYRKQKHDRMPYDLIPTLDINALRMMQRYLEADRMSIQKLQELENSITETSNALDGNDG